MITVIKFGEATYKVERDGVPIGWVESSIPGGNHEEWRARRTNGYFLDAPQSTRQSAVEYLAFVVR